ncbi:MAG: hypothetical protein AVDCRST_MAG88-155 [uncultured Thermomicrobiales bacterium]|uniref:Uncharacterized protein n=1 Tax=uncultured Thermomicrobiales bacterium TaxID=1645740 RepID=A0A6J4U9Y1_9BACT|nr:MAG: hypothetical protein AVDCRST_MAG88-155 [uncultured Thermomicrobiales bacterium]
MPGAWISEVLWAAGACRMRGGRALSQRMVADQDQTRKRALHPSADYLRPRRQ